MCGTGFVADVHGHKSRRILDHALTALGALSHRGGSGADGAGDGAGVLTHLPHAILRRHFERAAGPTRRAPMAADLGVGMVFLPTDATACARAMAAVERALRARDLMLLGWRHVPIRPEVLADSARASCPDIRQVLVRRPTGLTDSEFERALYLARRESEMALVGVPGFYVASMSHRTIVYKGLVSAAQISRFYPDLADPAYETAVALFHQRFSTNTFPTWALAQPFRQVAHNGEINTLLGNRNWMRARAAHIHGDWGADTHLLQHPILPGGSDSAALDNVYELLVRSGRDPRHAALMMLPPAHWMERTTDEVRGFFRYHEGLMEPWDGPAAIVATDGRYALAILDRNGLRPLRTQLTDDGVFVVGSESGIAGLDPGRVIERGRLGPGQILAVDLVNGRLLRDGEIKDEVARRRPYARWAAEHQTLAPSFTPSADERLPDDALHVLQLGFGYGRDDYRQILKDMAELQLSVWSMGDDTPLAVLSTQPQSLYDYFKQRFAQVTNPPIDPDREDAVMSLHQLIGPRGDLLVEDEDAARLLRFSSPVLDTPTFRWMQTPEGLPSRTLDATFPAADGPEGLATAVERLCADAIAAARQGALSILSDRAVGVERAPVPMLLATAAVHHHLIEAGLRNRTSIVCDAADARIDHHFACLIAYGASLVHPWLAYAGVAALGTQDPALGPERATAQYAKTVDKGLRKILAKVGISTLRSYAGGQVFEAIGLARSVVDRWFSGTPSRVGGADLAEIARDVLALHALAWPAPSAELPQWGKMRYRKGGEFHAFSPQTSTSLHHAVRTQDRAAYDAYAKGVESRPPTSLRDLLTPLPFGPPIPVDEVEPASAIARRFSTQAMSHGSLSSEAHEALAIAMNRLGAKSNSGEGGEDPARFGGPANSAIKQVASGRFGVTAAYLAAAHEIEIKMAQGSKPGEGGQLPGEKVTDEIAALRHSTPGVPLISPPPHHDIYSIEDLAQLIFDLRRVNPRVPVCVKLVSGPGIGTIAAGVAKAGADHIQVSGCDGGTGASPLSSIKHAGLPWELGLTEANQVLLANGLRDRVMLRVDGGLRSARDVILAALLGADAYGFGTIALSAIGCRMVRQCHNNTCPVGIATQDPALRARFKGSPEQVVTLMTFLAEQVREQLAALGARSLDELVGRTDRLEVRRDVDHPLDLSVLLQPVQRPEPDHGQRPPAAIGLDADVSDEVLRVVDRGLPVRRTFPIRNSDRSVGARLAGAIAERAGPAGLAEGTVRLTFLGIAGQSFGAFCMPGLNLRLEGEAQDYVGKGMSGGEIVVQPPEGAGASVLMGNTVLYGATGGTLFAAGRAGERLCVRNSGAVAVVEGCGAHALEYMTGGTVVILGTTGPNLGAGMSGGFAYVLDDGLLAERIHPASVRIEPVDQDVDKEIVRELLLRHLHRTNSDLALGLLGRFEETLATLRKVKPLGIVDLDAEHTLHTRLALSQARSHQQVA